MTVLSSHRQLVRQDSTLTRRRVLAAGSLAVAGIIGSTSLGLAAEANPVLEVAYAGSIGSLMEGPLKKAAAGSLRLELHGRGQGASALAQLIASGSLTPDVFLPITQSPVQTVFRAGKASVAQPVARTEMVIAYNPKSRFADKLHAAAYGRLAWWKVLQEPGFRFGRSDPAADPQGRNIIFTMMLAAKLYKQPDLVARVLGDTINRAQINMEASVQSRLQSGELDAASAYRIQPGPFHLPYIQLPREINLSGEQVGAANPDISLQVGGTTYRPEPLLYYAAVLSGAHNARGAAAFVAWLQGAEAQALLRANGYDAPEGAAALHA